MKIRKLLLTLFSTLLTAPTLTAQTSRPSVKITFDYILPQEIEAGQEAWMVGIQIAAESGNISVKGLAMTVVGFLNSDARNITSCQWFADATALNTGANVVIPSEKNWYTGKFRFDLPLRIKESGKKSLGLRCQTKGGVSGLYVWSFTPLGAVLEQDIVGESGERASVSFDDTQVRLNGSAQSPSMYVVAVGSPSTANVTGISLFPNSSHPISVNLWGYGTPGKAYRLDYSQDLKQWIHMSGWIIPDEKGKWDLGWEISPSKLFYRISP